MKKQFFLPALLLMGFTALTSCKKDNDDAVHPSTQACTLDHRTTSADSTQLTYDSENRVTKQQRFNNAGNSLSYSLYTYSSNKIIEKNYDENGDPSSQVDYHLNSNNNVAYSVYTEDGDYNAADTIWYSYDSEKHNIRRITKNTSLIVGFPVSTYDTTWYRYTGENLTKKEQKINNGSIETTVYSYGSDDAKSQFLAPEQNSAITNLYGNGSAQLATSMTNGSTTNSYVYAFNTEGYVTRMRTIDSGVTEQDVRFHYNCK